MPDTVAILVNWRGWRDTLRCLDALALQVPQPEVVVVDNASGDESVEQIRQAHPGVTLIGSPINLGFGGGCNLGIAHALGRGCKYVWLVNNDAEVLTGCHRALMAAVDADPSVGAAGGVLLDADGSSRIQVYGGGVLNLWFGMAIARRSPGSVDVLSGACMLIRAEALREVGGFDDQSFFMYWEDADLSLRLRQAGWQLAVAPQARLTHKLSASLGQGSPVLDRYFVTSGVRFLRRYAPLPGVAVGLMVFRMLLLRLLRGQWARSRAVLSGWRRA